MTKETKTVGGYILLSVPTIAYGGYFLLSLLGGQHDDLELTAFQKAMFRAGHAHAGVLVILSMVALPYIDQLSLSNQWKWRARVLLPLSAITISMGFFASATGKHLTQPNQFIFILYAGIAFLVAGVLITGIGLIRNNHQA
jgi:hypothetical protein